MKLQDLIQLISSKSAAALSLAILLIPAAGAAAQNRITVDVNYFTRGELRHGGLAEVGEDIEFSKGQDRAGFIVERTMLGFDYIGDEYETRLTAQHSGTWGSKEGGNFNVYEAWFKLKSPKGFFAQIGRQNLSYDDQRIFGSDDWSMTGRSHDALKVGYEGHGHKLHLVGAYNQNPENMTGGNYYTGGLQPYKAMEAMWYHFDVSRTGLGLSLLFMDIGMQGGEKDENAKTYRQQLYGTYMSFNRGRFDANAAYYRQGGREEHNLPIDAWMAAAKLSFKASDRFSVYGGYDYLSGDPFFATPPEGQIGMIRHETIKGFSSVYGSHHNFYGAMDFFYISTYRSGFTPGLQNAYAGIKAVPAKKTDIELSYHFFATATQLENAGKPLGHEVEFSASYALAKDTKLSIGYSFMQGTETMVVLKRSDQGRRLNWAWIMLTVNPRLLSGIL